MEKCNDDDVVISGIAGRFPESDDVNELWNNLMSGEELSTIDERRWPLDVFDIPKRSGKIKNLEKFDADYFSIKEQDAHCMDPQIRLLHETTWEAIFDAGINPDDLRGSKTSVCVGACFQDTLLAIMQNFEMENSMQTA
ncbi:fatty acid synthase-like protein, partial [Leptotrombidium deliense]